MTWGLVAFQPFAGATTNASSLVLQRLRETLPPDGFEFLPDLPVTFGGAWPALAGELAARPHLTGVVCFGQAAGRTRVDLERVALNYVDTATPDNDGVLPRRGRWREDRDLRWCPVPWENFVSDKCGRSYSAGTYVCNALYFDVLDWSERTGRPAAFIHVPVLASQSEFAAHAPVADEVVLAGVGEALAFLSR